MFPTRADGEVGCTLRSAARARTGTVTFLADRSDVLSLGKVLYIQVGHLLTFSTYGLYMNTCLVSIFWIIVCGQTTSQ